MQAANLARFRRCSLHCVEEAAPVPRSRLYDKDLGDLETPFMYRTATRSAASLAKRLLRQVRHTRLDREVVSVDLLRYIHIVADLVERIHARKMLGAEPLQDLLLEFLVVADLIQEHWDWSTIIDFVQLSRDSAPSSGKARAGKRSKSPLREYVRATRSLFSSKSIPEFASAALAVVSSTHGSIESCLEALIAARAMQSR